MKIAIVFLLLLLDISLSIYNVADDTHMSLDPPPFSWGVASGDPTKSSVILWTRVNKTDEPIIVSISTDKLMTTIVQTQQTTTDAPSHPSESNDYSVHLKITGLDSDTVYWYQFEVNSQKSRIGRTKTAPSTERDVKIGIISCSSHWDGWFNTYKALLNKDIDVIMHMGDVVYNSLPGAEFQQRRVPSPLPDWVDPHILEDWRQLHEFLRHDVDFRNLLAHIPWIVQWDNHDVVEEGGEKAFFEWFPLEVPDVSHYIDAKQAYVIDRQINYGPLVDIFVIDTHLGHKDGGGKLVGQRQMNNLIKSIPESTARYRVLSSTKTMSPWKIARLPFKLFHKGAEVKDLGKGALHPRNWFNHWRQKKEGRYQLWKSKDLYFDLGLWDGSPIERRELLKVLHTKGNNIVVSGDTHTSLAADVINADEVHSYTPCNDHASAVEFAPASVSRSNWDEGLITKLKLDPKSNVKWAVNYVRAAMCKANPHHTYLDLSQHGYGILTISMDKIQGDYFYVDRLVPMDDEVTETNPAALIMKYDTKCWDRDESRIPAYYKTFSGVLGGHIRHKAGKGYKWFKGKFTADIGYNNYYDYYDDYYDQYYYNEFEDMESEYDNLYNQLLDKYDYGQYGNGVYDNYEDDLHFYYYHMPQWYQPHIMEKKQSYK